MEMEERQAKPAVVDWRKCQVVNILKLCMVGQCVVFNNELRSSKYFGLVGPKLGH